MPHIHVNPSEHDFTASAYIIRLDTDEPTLMLHRHRKLGAWLQFGGHIELKENPWQTIIREIQEESGYGINELEVMQPKYLIKAMSGVVLLPVPIASLTHKFPGLDHYHTDIGYGFTAEHPPSNRPRERESELIECFTLEQLQELPSGEIPQNIVETGTFLLTDGITHWGRIPASNWTIETPHAHFEGH